MKQFEAYEYFTDICKKLKITKDNDYYPCKVSGLANMEGVIANLQSKRAYFAIDDTNDGQIYKGAGGGYFERKMYIVFVLKKFPFEDMNKQHEALNECRSVYRSICTKLISDKSTLSNNMIYLHTDRIPFYEMTGYGIAGCTGLYFMITVEQPINLCYDANQWNE
jgi:hypothetical protein